jgi:hypothetical protein
MSILLLGNQYMMISELVDELNDSVMFMETLMEFEDEEVTQRRTDKENLIESTNQFLKEFESELMEKLENGEDDNSYRFCSECERIMIEGYLINDGDEYYCSDDCLERNMTKEEYLESYADGEGSSYYTAWEG